MNNPVAFEECALHRPRRGTAARRAERRAQLHAGRELGPGAAALRREHRRPDGHRTLAVHGAAHGDVDGVEGRQLVACRE